MVFYNITSEILLSTGFESASSGLHVIHAIHVVLFRPMLIIEDSAGLFYWFLIFTKKSAMSSITPS